MKLTTNFDRKEFDCKDGTKVPDHLMNNLIEYVSELQKLRDLIGEPIFINSGYRTESYNKKVKGLKGSYHLKALAGDLKPKSIKVSDLYDLILVLMKVGYLKKGGLKNYGNFVHYDIRGKIVLF